MIPKSSCYPVDGSLESGPEGKAQCFVSGVAHAAGRPDGFTGGVRQLEVSIYCLKTKEVQDTTSVSERTTKVRTVILFTFFFVIYTKLHLKICWL